MEKCYLRGAYGMTGWEGESNESMFEICRMGPCANEVNVV